MRLPVLLDLKGVEKRGRKEPGGRRRLYCQLLSLVATAVASILLAASDLRLNIAAEEAKKFMSLPAPPKKKNIPLVASVVLRILDNNRVVSQPLSGTVKNGIKRDV